VRKVLGSLRGQLLRQFIFETGFITFAGMAIAVIIAYTICPYVNLMFNMQLSINLFSDPDLILFIVGLTVGVTLFAGYYPGLVLAGFKPVTALKGKLSQMNVKGLNTRRTLIITQFAISQVLIIGMIVIIHQLQFARQSDLGFSKNAIVMASTGEEQNLVRKNGLKNEIAGIPGVKSVSLCYAAPASEHDWNNSIKFESTEEVNFRTSIKAADADYVKLFDLELAAGRNLSPADTVREMLVNEALVRKLGLKSPEDALGRIIIADGGDIVAPIVGVVKDFHDKSFYEEINPILLTTFTEDYIYYAIQLNLANAKPTLEAIEKLWTAQHPDELFHYEFLDDNIAKFYQTEETMLALIQIFSFVAIFIGCLGLYGLVSFMTAQKTKEVGIRKVLGGSIGHILWIFGKEFSRLIVFAFLVATPMGWWLMNMWLQEFEFQIEMGPWIFLLAIGSSFFIAAITVGYQVTKTALMNPVRSLRTE
jgi:putative ABC transport system permease protein